MKRDKRMHQTQMDFIIRHRRHRRHRHPDGLWTDSRGILKGLLWGSRGGYLPLGLGCSEDGDFALGLGFGGRALRQRGDLDRRAREADDVADVRSSRPDDGPHRAVRDVKVTRFLFQIQHQSMNNDPIVSSGILGFVFFSFFLF